VQLPIRYTRIYGLDPTQLATPTKHQSSPILLADVPKGGIQSELHIGEVPSDILRALRLTHAWLDGLFRGNLASVDDLERSASEISTETILPEPANSRRTPGITRWYVTLIINDHIEIPRDSAQKLYGVELGSWANFDSPELFNKYEDALDFQAVQVAFLLAPYRYIWLAWDDPLVQLPTGITLRPPYFRLGRGRVFSSPGLDRVDLSGFASAASTETLKSIPMSLHLYLKATTETDPIARFFDAFRALEVLCNRLVRRSRGQADENVADGAAAGQYKAIEALKGSKLRKQFATIALAINPKFADADLDKFTRLKDWRDDLAHGIRRLESDESPDEEVFELLHRYLAGVTDAFA
jgi:hypothetical protein